MKYKFSLAVKKMCLVTWCYQKSNLIITAVIHTAESDIVKELIDLNEHNIIVETF